MLVELAIGDAYGAGFEFAPDEFVATHTTPSALTFNTPVIPRNREATPMILR